MQKRFENKKLHITKKLLHYKNLQQNCVAKDTKDFLPFIAKSTCYAFKNCPVIKNICEKFLKTVCKNKKLYVIQKTLHYKNLQQNYVAQRHKRHFLLIAKSTLLRFPKTDLWHKTFVKKVFETVCKKPKTLRYTKNFTLQKFVTE